MLIGILLTDCGICELPFQVRQLAASAGGSINVGTVDVKFQSIGGTIIAVLGGRIVTLSIRCCSHSKEI
jgi:hypothetical protein